MENWKDIKGYEGNYQICIDVRVKAIQRYVDIGLGRKQLKPEKILKPAIGSHGYFSVVLCKNKKQTSTCIHRIIAEAFIENTNNHRCINHIDGNKLNNQLSNLEWCSHSHNNKHAYDTGLKKGWIPTEQHKINHSNKLKGRKLTEEHKYKISVGLNSFYNG
jgi:hypothetical protein